MDATETVTAYGDSWNEPDEAKRRALLESAWADDATYCDPTASVDGRDALLTHIAGFREAFPGARIETASGVDVHHGWGRFAWSMVGADGAVAMEGFDVCQFADDGRLQRIVGFFGPFPPMATGS
jgi:hypothetical protein